MRDERDYTVSLADLERDARVPREEQVESVEPQAAPLPDVRGEQPDRDWFHSGG